MAQEPGERGRREYLDILFEDESVFRILAEVTTDGWRFEVPVSGTIVGFRFVPAGESNRVSH